MAIINRAKGLTGLNPLAYMGVEGAEAGNTVTPFVAYPEDPVVNDWQNFNLGTLWLNTINNNLWYLASLAGNQAKWILLSGGFGNIIGLQPDVGLVVNAILGIINAHNTDGNIITSNGGTNNLDFNLANNIVIQNNISSVSGNITVNAGVIQTVNGSIFAASNSTVPLTNSSVACLRMHGVGGTVVAGDALGAFSSFGWDGATYTAGAAIIMQTDAGGTIASHRMPTSMAFLTAPNSALIGPGFTPPTRMIIASDGTVQVKTADAGSALTSTFSAVGNVASAGDDGACKSGYNALTNVSVGVSSGVNTLKSTTAGGGQTNAGYIKIYVGTTPAYVPYFTTT
jgi:hypothetical protein